jgi:hypothetical protein
MKALVIDNDLTVSEFEVKDFEGLYKKCGYRSLNRFDCLANITLNSDNSHVEFWGKKSKQIESYTYRDLLLYNKCAIILRNGGLIAQNLEGVCDLTFDYYNDAILNAKNEETNRDNTNRDNTNRENDKSLDKTELLKSKEDLEEVINNELLPEDYIYTSDEEDI